MGSLLALLAFLNAAGAHVERVSVPGPDGTVLESALVRPAGPPRAPAIVALHGCAGPFPARDGTWAAMLAAQGHFVLLPDSFGSRGIASQCGVKDRAVQSSGLRRRDAIDAARWLAAQPGVPPGGIALLGWSDGGNTALWTARARADLPAGLFRRFVAFYPGCKTALQTADFRPVAPLLILVGDNDDWTPAGPCRDLAARHPDSIALQTFAGAWHDFDAPNTPVAVHAGLATPPSGTGQAHTGTDQAARQDALRLVPAFLDASP